ncbi:MAG: pilin [Christensenellaceae bacterium]|nr:pilin [Christensenellaceae bacterium]
MKLFSLIGASVADLGKDDPVVRTMNTIGNAVDIAVVVFMAICASLIVFYAIWVGFNFAKATDDAKRAQAKSQLIYSIIGLVGITVISTLFGTVLKSYTKISAITPDGATDFNDTVVAATKVLAIVNTISSVVLKTLTSAATIFAVWVGWQLMKAEDDAKRKQAKTQLIYTAIGIVVIVAIQAIAGAIFTGAIGSKINSASRDWE